MMPMGGLGMAPQTAPAGGKADGAANPQMSQQMMYEQQQLIYQQMAMHQHLYQQYQSMLA